MLAAWRLGASWPPLTARRVRHGVGGQSASPKSCFRPPPLFQQLSESPFLPFPLLHSILPQASAGSAPSPPWSPLKRRGQSEKYLVVIGGSYSLDPLSSIVSSTSPAVVLHSVMTLADYLAFRPSATYSRDGLRCNITTSFL